MVLCAIAVKWVRFPAHSFRHPLRAAPLPRAAAFAARRAAALFIPAAAGFPGWPRGKGWYGCRGKQLFQLSAPACFTGEGITVRGDIGENFRHRAAGFALILIDWHFFISRLNLLLPPGLIS